MTWVLFGVAVLLGAAGAGFLAVVARVRRSSLPYTLLIEDGAVAERARREDWFAAVRAELERLGFTPAGEFILPGLRGNVVNQALFQAQPPTYAVLTEVAVPTPEGEQQAHALTLQSTLDDGRIVQTTTRATPSTSLAAGFLVEQSLPGARATRVFVTHVERLHALARGGATVADRTAVEFRARYAEVYDRLQQAEVSRGMRQPPDGGGRVRLTWKGAARLVVRGLLHRARG